MKLLPISLVAILMSPVLLVTTAAEAKKPIELHFGDQPWHLVLLAADLKPIPGAPGGPDRQIFTYRNDRKMLLSVMVENANEPATPITTPASDKSIPCRMTSRRTSLCCAPSATRMPNARVRCVTA